MEVMLVADLVDYFASARRRSSRRADPAAPAQAPRAATCTSCRAAWSASSRRGTSRSRIPLGETMMALIAGNAVVLKPSEVTPLIALKAKELYRRLRAAARSVPGRHRPRRRPAPRSSTPASTTASSPARSRPASKVAAACGERLIPCTLELGGKAPAIVCADADLDRTARALVWGAFANQRPGVRLGRARLRASRRSTTSWSAKIVAQTRELRQGDAPPTRGRRRRDDLGSPGRDRRGARRRRRSPPAPRCATGGKRRAGPGPVLRADRAHRLPPGHGRHAQGDLRPGHADHEGARRGGGGRARQRLAPRPARLRVHARPRRGASASPSASRPAP